MRLWLVGLAFLTLVLHHAACMMAAEGFGAVAPGDVPEGGGGGGGGADDDCGDGGGGKKRFMRSTFLSASNTALYSYCYLASLMRTMR
jgi:hypothetical protein